MSDKKNNSGNRNSGNRNSGDLNSGDWNSGDWNSGNRNSGDLNSGNWNSGNRNSGNRNSGNLNSGNWNSGNWNSGYLNTDSPKIRIFNKETDQTLDGINFPSFFYFTLTEWIKESEMTDKEKEAYPSYVTTGGYLKVYDYKQAWKNSWLKATPEDRAKVKELPNFDADIFYEISGIRVNENDKLELTIDEIADKFGVDVSKVKIKK